MLDATSCLDMMGGSWLFVRAVCDMGFVWMSAIQSIMDW